MIPEPGEPVLLKLPAPRSRAWVYPWWGFLLGFLGGVFIGQPLSMLVENIYRAIYEVAPFAPLEAVANGFTWHRWPMMLLYGLSGGVFCGIIGQVFKRLQEQRLLLEMLYHEFELKVATLRHHYKNLAIGIRGFSDRIKRKLQDLDHQVYRCMEEKGLPRERCRQILSDLEYNGSILDDAAQRLTVTLSQELMFIKALAGEPAVFQENDIYPVLVSAIRDLLGLRFRDKVVRVEINGRPWEECRESLIFAFEPYTMEVILQNLLSNAMKYGDYIQVQVTEFGDWVRVSVEDNGPGAEMETLKQNLVGSTRLQEPDSTNLGLRVNLHLLEKCGGHLKVWSRVGAGAVFISEFPKHLAARP